MKNKTLTLISLVLSVMTVAMTAISLQIKLSEMRSDVDLEIGSEIVESESMETEESVDHTVVSE